MKTKFMRLACLILGPALLCFTPQLRAQSNLVTFEFSGVLNPSTEDLSYFPGNFGAGCAFRGTMTFDLTVEDFNPEYGNIGLFILENPLNSFRVSVTDLLGVIYDFVAVQPSILIYANYLDTSVVDCGSGHFTAYDRGFLFSLSFNDYAHAIIPNDQLSGFVPGASWDQVCFTLSSNTGVPRVNGLAVVIPPRLNITSPNPAQVQIAWSGIYPGYTLETSSNLSPAIWEPLTNSVAVNGQQFSVVVEASEAGRFFRLRKN